MRDKVLGVWLILLFGLSGLAVMTLAWFWPALQPDRFSATVAGSGGILMAAVQVVMLRRAPITSGKRVPVEITNES